jgi:hypothetical protein
MGCSEKSARRAAVGAFAVALAGALVVAGADAQAQVVVQGGVGVQAGVGVQVGGTAYAPPPPVVQRDAHGVLVTAETRLIAGQALRAQWGAGWFDAQVIAVESGGARIHYTGYGDMWNEVVPLHRLRIAG